MSQPAALGRSANTPRLRSRQIAESDLEAIAKLLSIGFPRRSQAYWREALARLSERPVLEGFPKYGFVFDYDGAPVGVLLLIHTRVLTPSGVVTRCNVSSWYVEEKFRSFATLFISRALNAKDVTYFNISPADHVQPIILAQGFVRYCDGQFVAYPHFGLRSAKRSAIVGVAEYEPRSELEQYEQELLRAHEKYGCVSFWCLSAEAVRPFVLLPRVVKRMIPCAQLVYCRDVADLVMFKDEIGRLLLRKRRPFLLVDSNGPIAGLQGRYFPGVSPKYYKGPHRPRLGDLSYTEAAMFGL
jgi:hypothetical protein